RLPLRGYDLLRNPHLNRGSAFTMEERDEFGLHGLVPARVFTLDEQVERALGNVRRTATPLGKYINLARLLERNETVFYRVVIQHVTEMMPIIYTPTVGEACQHFGEIFGRPRGLTITPRYRGRIKEVLHNWPTRHIEVLVVTDGERILGLGDLGAQGMGIPHGKLALYTACAGIDPTRCLPVMLDVGTDNATLRESQFYNGLRQPRLRGPEYDAFVAEFVDAVKEVFPEALLQWEDFATDNAFRLLQTHREQIRSFNDDIQGTAGVTVAGLYSACRATGTKLSEQCVLFYGAGAAATGIGELLVEAMMQDGLSEADARLRCWFMDSKGLVTKSRTDLQAHKIPFAHEHSPILTLEEAVRQLKPTALIGVAAQPKVFTEPVLRAMTELTPRPIVFALSNPTSKMECTSEEAYRWTDGKAIFASGSPAPSVTLHGQLFVPSQANNVYIFPGLGLGVVAAQTRIVTDSMFLAAARALASIVGEEDLKKGALFPPMDSIRATSVTIAAAVVRIAVQEGLATVEIPEDIEGWVEERMYQPVYPPIPTDRRTTGVSSSGANDME
ncbi:MAG: NAD-dependent malic enzyme, partial [Gemmatimonadaceae bacterium]